MFTAYIYTQYISQAFAYWNGWHLASLWFLGAMLDLMLLLIVVTAVLSARVWLGAGGADASRSTSAQAVLRLAKALHGLDRILIMLGGLALAALVLVTFVSVIGRSVWRPIPDDITFAEFAMVALVALTLGTIQGRDDHIEVTAFTDQLSVRVNLILRLFGSVLGLLIIGRLALVSLEEVPDSFLEIAYGSIYELPLWPPRLMFMVGVCWWLTRIALQSVMLPVLLRLETTEPGNAFDPVPIASRLGTGEAEVDLKTLEEKSPLNEADETGGARGA